MDCRFSPCSLKNIGRVFHQKPLSPRFESRYFDSPSMADLLRSEVRAIDCVWLRGSADQLLPDEPLALKSDIDVPPSPVDHDTAFKNSVAPLLFSHRRCILQISFKYH